jgi:hypothetical protein
MMTTLTDWEGNGHYRKLCHVDITSVQSEHQPKHAFEITDYRRHREGRDLASPLPATTCAVLEQYLEQDHRAIKRRVNAKQGFREFQAARRTIQGYEAMNMIRKGQIRWVSGDDLLCQIRFIRRLFDLAT